MTTRRLDEVSSESLRALMRAAGAQYITFIYSSTASVDVKLYRDEHGREYITDGADAYAQASHGFAKLKIDWFG